MANRLDITYDRDEREIVVYDESKDLLLICTDISFEDTHAILVEGDYLTPNDWVGGKTAEEKAEDYYWNHPEMFEEVER